MRLHHLVVVALALACLMACPASACIWDYDTLKQEQSRFPGVLELITGKFLRHSKEFYYWRINDRYEKLKAEPSNLDYLDDLAVAYHKVGNTTAHVSDYSMTVSP